MILIEKVLTDFFYNSRVHILNLESILKQF